MAMQGEQLKRIRQALGITQGQMADRLGMTQTFIGMMERDERPIELRTELAARQLLNERSPTYGARANMPEADGDVPLKDAVIYWEPRDPGMPPVVVQSTDAEQYFCSYGADSGDWHDFDTTGRLLRLFTRFHELTVSHGIAPADVHAAFIRIPEYRAAVELGTLPESLRPER